MTLEGFKRRYKYRGLDQDGEPMWAGIIFRAGADYTSPFGIDDTFGILRIHNAVDREAGTIWVPFTCVTADFIDSEYTRNAGFGTILRLFPEGADFEIRIMHMDYKDIDVTVRERIMHGRRLEQGEILGRAGSRGLSVGGNHTHVETVSLGDSSVILEALGNELFTPTVMGADYTEQELRTRVRALNNLEQYDEQRYQSERRRRHIHLLNDVKCIREDYLEHYTIRKTFYSSRALFNM